MERKDFEKLVVLGLKNIPEKFRKKIKNVAILIDDEPSDELRRQENLAPNETLLGLYKGVPHSIRGDNYGVGPTLPDTITVFQRPIEEKAGNDRELIKQIVVDVIWHEYAHYFGMSETDVRNKEKARRNKKK